MCLKLEEINKKIERCQAQIAAIYDLPESEQCPITLEGFQRQLKFLLNEKSMYDITVYSTPVKQANRPQNTAQASNTSIKERALQACHCTIQEVKLNRV